MKSRLLAAAGAALMTAMVVAAVAIAARSDDQSAALYGKIDPSKPKNVILLVGDGMGDSEVTLGRYYGKGANGRLNMDDLPFRGSSIHYVLEYGPGPNFLPNYTGDSAPTATAWSTGKRTTDERLSQGPSSAKNVPGSNVGFRTYLEIARDRGMATGNVSTAEITDATPAAPSSHISQRACHGPGQRRARSARWRRRPLAVSARSPSSRSTSSRPLPRWRQSAVCPGSERAGGCPPPVRRRSSPTPRKRGTPWSKTRTSWRRSTSSPTARRCSASSPTAT